MVQGNDEFTSLMPSPMILEVIEENAVSVVFHPVQILDEVVLLGPQGPRGIQGIRGPAGPDTSLVTLEAGEAVGGHRVVSVRSTGVFYADNETATDYFRSNAVTTGAAALGDDVEVCFFGLIDEPSWSWTEALPIFIGSNGQLTQTPPSSPALFSRVAGYATSPTQMYVQFGPPVVLS